VGTIDPRAGSDEWIMNIAQNDNLEVVPEA